jgi:manganese/zinc/iron transport system permease protein
MSPAAYEFVCLDLPAMLAGTLAVVLCGLLGNFLLLRRLSLMGDAISHSVLPGLVAGFLIVGTRESLPMFLGAAAAGLATVFLVEVIRKLARLDAGAAMGVVFSILFALGVLLIEQAAARGVDLDPDCVLNGQLERIFWFPPRELSGWSIAILAELPREIWTLAILAALAGGFIALFFKELRLAAFDPALAQTVGVNPRLVNGAFMVLVAAAVVASFEAVGSILVIAMLVCPPAAARLLTDRLAAQIWLSLVFSVLIGAGGYTAAALVPEWLGVYRADAGSGGGGPVPLTLNAAGMMTLVGGFLLALTMLLAPRYGVFARRRGPKPILKADEPDTAPPAL